MPPVLQVCVFALKERKRKRKRKRRSCFIPPFYCFFEQYAQSKIGLLLEEEIRVKYNHTGGEDLSPPRAKLVLVIHQTGPTRAKPQGPD
jgi:hypothetical protein